MLHDVAERENKKAMTTKNINGREVVFVEVEETAKGFWIDKDSLFYKWDKDIIHHSLPDGEFKIIGLASSLSEEQWAGIELPNGMKPGTTLLLIKEK